MLLWLANTLPLPFCAVEYDIPSLDFSKLTRLKEVTLASGPSVQWITTTLQTVKSTKLEQITIHSPIAFMSTIAESDYREWGDLDRLLLQFWTSRSIRLKFGCKNGKDGRDFSDTAPRLLPELTSRGTIDLVEWSSLSGSLLGIIDD